MEESIEIIFVRPRNKYYVEYALNGSDSMHTKTYDDIKEYLYEIIPERVVQINYALMRFQSFIIQVPSKEFTFLQLADMADHIEGIKDFIKNPTVEDAMVDVKIQNKKTIDDKMKDLSEIDLSKSWSI